MTAQHERIMIWIFPTLIVLSLVWGILHSPLATLTIMPATATLDVDQTLQLQVEGHNTRHKVVHNVQVAWAVEGKSGHITPQGLLTGVAPGVVKVTATSDKIRGTATMTVESARVASLAVNSAPATVPVGGQSLLTIAATTSQGKGLPGVEMQVAATTAGTTVTPTQVVTDAAGQATVTLTAAPQVLANTVEIRAGAQRTTAVVKGLAGAAATVYTSIEPREVTAGQAVQLRVRVQDQAGNLVPEVPVRFVAGHAATVPTPAEARTDAQGMASTTVQTAPKAGGNPVQVQVAGLPPLNVTVLGVAGAATQLTLQTETAETVAGAEVSLTALARDAQDNAVAGLAVTFTLTTSDGTPITTTALTDTTGVASTVLPTPLTAGSLEIQANALEFTAPLTITTHPAVALQIEPATATVAMQGSQTLRAMATTASGQQGEVAPQWQAQGTAGPVNAQGIFIATALGTATIHATYGKLQAAAHLTVVPGDIAGIQITPSEAIVTAGTQQRFQGVAVNPHSYPLQAPLSWNVTPPALGSMDANGVFTAALTGSGNVVATTPGHTAQARVTVVPGALAALTVQPKTVQVQAGEEVQLRASGRDAAGNIVTVTPTWSIANDLGKLSPLGRFRARRAGIGSLQVMAGAGIAADIPVQVVPGALHHMALQPDTVAVAAGTEHTFVAMGYDAFGNMLAVAPTWRLEPDLGSLDAQGKFAAQRTGTARVQATVDNVTAQGTVAVTPGPVVTLEVQPPGPLTLTAGETVSFSFSGQDAYGNPVAHTPLWNQPIALGTLAPDGTFRAEKAGQGVLEIRSDNQHATVQLTITPGELARLAVIPATLTLRAGERQTFQAQGFDALNNEVPVQATWQVTEALGTISANGEFMATQARSGQVSATVSGFAASVSVTVQPGPLAGITVSPEQIKLAAGESVQVSVSGVDAHGNTLTVQPRWQPSVGPGTISREGIFTAQKAGDGQLVVLADGQTATIPVHVERGAVATLRLAPTVLRLTSGQQHQCALQGFDRGGNEVPITPQWELQGNIGTLTPEGLFTATVAGQGTIQATVGTLVITAEVTVDPGEAVSLRVEPATATLKAGETLTLQSAAVDAAGNRVHTPLTWSVEGDLGTVSSAGIFTARRLGTGKITAALDRVTQVVTVQIEPGPLAILTLSPATLTVRTGSKQAFVATGTDAYGNAVPIEPIWSVQGNIGRIDAQGMFEATTSGSGAVVAVVGNIAGLAPVTVAPTTTRYWPQEPPRRTLTAKQTQ